MPANWQARSGIVGNLVIAGTLALGLSGPLLLRAQEPGGAAKNSPRTEVQNSGPPAREQDPGSLRAQWRTQQIAARRAEAKYNDAKLTREIAEIAVHAYEEGIYEQDRATVVGEIKLAEWDLSRAEDRVDWVRRQFNKGFVPRSTKTSAELALKKSRFALEQAQAKRKVLVDYTKGKTVTELKSEVEKTRSDELAKKAVWLREKATEADLERQVGRPQPTNAKPTSR